MQLGQHDSYDSRTHNDMYMTVMNVTLFPFPTYWHLVLGVSGSKSDDDLWLGDGVFDPYQFQVPITHINVVNAGANGGSKSAYLSTELLVM